MLSLKVRSLKGSPGCPAAEQPGSEPPWQSRLKHGGSRAQPPPHIQQLPELPSAEPRAAPARSYWSSWLRPSPADDARENQAPAVPFPLPSSSQASLRAAVTAATSPAPALLQPVSTDFISLGKVLLNLSGFTKPRQLLYFTSESEQMDFSADQEAT